MDSIPPTPHLQPASTEESSRAKQRESGGRISYRVAVPYSNSRVTRPKLAGGDLQGRIIEDRYRLTFPLGRGGMSTVYLARDMTCGRHYAIKVLHRDLVERSRYRRRFFNEIESVRRVNHPAVVRMFELGELDDGRLFIVMEYVRGVSLKQAIAKGPVPMERTVSIVSAVAAGLRAAHSRGVIHRDLKPANVLIPRRGEGGRVAKIVDFGLARIVGSPSLTRSSEIMGTPLYLSPEQATGAAADHRCDVYSLGVLMYEMTTGERLFSGRDAATLIRQHASKRPIPVRKRRPDLSIPPILEDLIMKCLEKRPDKRPYDMNRVLAILRLFDGSEGYRN